METIKDPESWTDFDMDWNDPDPLNACYYRAILKAMDERKKAFAVSGQRTNYGWAVYYRNRFQIPSVGMMKLWADDILWFFLQGSEYIVSKDQFFNDKTATYDNPPSLSDLIPPGFANPVPGIGYPISQAKDFLIWAKKTLDSLTVFTYPYVKINYYNPVYDDYIWGNYHQDPAVKDEQDKIKRLEIAASLFIDEHSRDITVKDVVCQSFNIKLITSAYGDAADVQTWVKLPESTVIRSFARPKIYCMIKPYPWYEPVQTKRLFCDFGYGFEANTNKVLDLGQLPEEKDAKVDLFQFQLERMRPYICTGDGISNEFQARCYFALDYNVEGGFKFRPGV